MKKSILLLCTFLLVSTSSFSSEENKEFQNLKDIVSKIDSSAYDCNLSISIDNEDENTAIISLSAEGKSLEGEKERVRTYFQIGSVKKTTWGFGFKRTMPGGFDIPWLSSDVDHIVKFSINRKDEVKKITLRRSYGIWGSDKAECKKID